MSVYQHRWATADEDIPAPVAVSPVTTTEDGSVSVASRRRVEKRQEVATQRAVALAREAFEVMCRLPLRVRLGLAMHLVWGRRGRV